MSRLPYESQDGSDSVDESVPLSDSTRKPVSEKTLTVSEASSLIRAALNTFLPRRLAVVGEISNFSDRNHWFFSIKDEGSTLRCVCFASSSRRVKFRPSDGMAVVVRGRVDFYDVQGHVQLYVDQIDPVGEGILELRLRQLMSELRDLGYFDEGRKRRPPVLPRCIAVVTSRNAAALQDVINTASRRWRGCRLLLYDVHVQGESAASEIAEALTRISDQHDRFGIDAVLLTRGGGSIEDLWSFNERIVADAIFRSQVPVVAAIGHETDTTVAELVADIRCSTPTQAAMVLLPDAESLSHQLSQLSRRLSLLVGRLVQYERRRVDHISGHVFFRRPGQLIEEARRRLAVDSRQLRQVLPHRLLPASQKLEMIRRSVLALLPRRLAESRSKLEACRRHLDAVGPGNVLRRGYSYTLDGRGEVLKRASDVSGGDRITTVLQDGRLTSLVEPVGGIVKPRRSGSRCGRDEADSQGMLFK